MESEERPSKRARTGSPPVDCDRQSESSESSSPNVDQPDIATVDADGKPLSKNQQKKLRRKALWEARRDDRRAKRKEKAQRARNRKRIERQEAIKNGIPPQPNEHVVNVRVPTTVIIDCSFNDLMFEHELKSLAGQISRCYSENRKAQRRIFLSISSFEGALKARFEEGLGGTYNNWTADAKFHSEDFVAVSNNSYREMLSGVGSIDRDDSERSVPGPDNSSALGEVVYLSSEAEETLQALKPYGTYIIGGLVDHNRHKGICHQRAQERGIRTAKLPIGEYLKMSSRQVLATNHVFEILLKFIENDGDWEKAFTEVIPKRKEWKVKDKESREAESAEPAEEVDNQPKPEEEHDTGIRRRIC